MAVGGFFPVSWTNVKVSAVLNALGDTKDILFWKKGPDFDGGLNKEKNWAEICRTE